jgi:hypothetical protein
MADAPFAAVGVAEQSGGGEEASAPPPHPSIRIGAVDGPKDAFDLVAMPRAGHQHRQESVIGAIAQRYNPIQNSR